MAVVRSFLGRWVFAGVMSANHYVIWRNDGQYEEQDENRHGRVEMLDVTQIKRRDDSAYDREHDHRRG